MAIPENKDTRFRREVAQGNRRLAKENERWAQKGGPLQQYHEEQARRLHETADEYDDRT